MGATAIVFLLTRLLGIITVITVTVVVVVVAAPSVTVSVPRGILPVFIKHVFFFYIYTDRCTFLKFIFFFLRWFFRFPDEVVLRRSILRPPPPTGRRDKISGGHNQQVVR